MDQINVGDHDSFLVLICRQGFGSHAVLVGIGNKLILMLRTFATSAGDSHASSRSIRNNFADIIAPTNARASQPPALRSPYRRRHHCSSSSALEFMSWNTTSSQGPSSRQEALARISFAGQRLMLVPQLIPQVVERLIMRTIYIMAQSSLVFNQDLPGSRLMSASAAMNTHNKSQLTRATWYR